MEFSHKKVVIYHSYLNLPDGMPLIVAVAYTTLHTLPKERADHPAAQDIANSSASSMNRNEPSSIWVCLETGVALNSLIGHRYFPISIATLGVDTSSKICQSLPTSNFDLTTTRCSAVCQTHISTPAFADVPQPRLQLRG